jgi:signal transduction histidine kinase
MSHFPKTSIQIQRVLMKTSQTPQDPKWAEPCISSPQTGIKSFLLTLCNVANAPYAHVRVKSRSGKFYKLSESIGPYKKIGWPRRFHLLDEKDGKNIYYKLVDYKSAKDYESLKGKFPPDTEEYQYLDSLVCGCWLPITINDIDLGYVTLSWDKEQKDKSNIINAKKYIKTYSSYLPLVYQACRSIIADEHLSNLWPDIAEIQSSINEHELYSRIADACINLWGNGATVYIGEVSTNNNYIEVVKVAGYRANEANKNAPKRKIPLNKGIFGYLLKNSEPLLSYSLANDKRFKYHSMREDGRCQGSAIAIPISDSTHSSAIALLSVEHELINYFDYDDIRYITGIARIGYQTITEHEKVSEKTSRDFDALFTGVAHDVIEPLQAIVADAEVLRYEVSNALGHLYKAVDVEKILSSTLARSTNFLEEALNLHKLMKRHLDAGTGEESTKVTNGIIRIYPFLNALTDQWQPRAESHGIQIRALYDSLKDIKICCDESELKSALGHLLGNAVKYSFWGKIQKQGEQSKYGRHIKIKGRVKMDMAIIEFENFGIGILNEEINSIREKYHRGKLAMKEGRAGTGRGLWTVDQFLASINGYMTIVSNPATEDLNGPYSNSFFIHLPIQKTQETDNG